MFNPKRSFNNAVATVRQVMKDQSDLKNGLFLRAETVLAIRPEFEADANAAQEAADQMLTDAAVIDAQIAGLAIKSGGLKKNANRKNTAANNWQKANGAK